MPAFLAQTDPTLWMPQQASTYAGDVDWLFYFIFFVSVFFTILIAGLVVFFAWRYRHKSHQDLPRGATHSTPLEITWSIIPLILVMMMFVWGFRGFLNMASPPAGAYEVLVTARKWGWSFTYPNGVVSDRLHVPADRPVRLVLESQDVIHSLYVPAFRLKKDAVPGRYNKAWFQATPGDALVAGNPVEYDLYCTEYCGTLHSQMITKVVVHTPEGFAKWLEDSNDPTATPPLVLGEKLRSRHGCAQCHSVDGAGGTGPTWQNLFGAQRQFAGGGSAVADEQYLRDSIVNPGSQIVAGYDNIMPSYKGRLKDVEITAIIEYMKSISDNYDGPLMEQWAPAGDTQQDQDSGGGSGAGDAGASDPGA